jgi:GH15 family glucan-1,4-alpha-glucosidase
MSAPKPHTIGPTAHASTQKPRPGRHKRQSALSATLPRPHTAPAVRDAHSLDEQALDLALIGNGRIMRYTADDDFGAPETAFLACNFWYIEALALVGCRDEAREFFIGLLDRRNSFGLLSEDIHPQTGALWGNFPQTYSMAGIIHVATRLSEKWEDVWCRVSS